MPVRKHLTQSHTNKRRGKPVEQRPAGKGEVNPIHETSGGPFRVELVAMDPSCKRAPDLFIHKEAIAFKRRVACVPPNRPDAQVNLSPGRNPPGFVQHSQRREGWRQQLKRVGALVEPKHHVHWGLNDGLLFE